MTDRTEVESSRVKGSSRDCEIVWTWFLYDYLFSFWMMYLDFWGVDLIGQLVWDA